MNDYETRYTRYLVNMILYVLDDNAGWREKPKMTELERKRTERDLLNVPVKDLEKIFNSLATVNNALINGASL